MVAGRGGDLSHSCNLLEGGLGEVGNVQVLDAVGLDNVGWISRLLAKLKATIKLEADHGGLSGSGGDDDEALVQHVCECRELHGLRTTESVTVCHHVVELADCPGKTLWPEVCAFREDLVRLWPGWELVSDPIKSDRLLLDAIRTIALLVILAATFTMCPHDGQAAMTGVWLPGLV